MNFGEKLQNLVLSSVVILTFCSLCSIIPTEISNQISTLFSAASLSTPLSIVIVMMVVVMVMMVLFIVLTGFFVLLIHLFVMFVTVFEIILIVVVIPVVVVFVASANGD